MNAPSQAPSAEKPMHFIRELIRNDLAAGANGGKVVTRFPPEPNGYLHIGHAKAICIDFGMAAEFSGLCHLRMDDTNPAKEEVEYIESIKEDVRWLGFRWDKFFHASDFFGKMYDFCELLLSRGEAYVCALTQEEWKEYRGVPTRPGRESPHRNRPPAESVELFRRMRAGEFKDGELCVRAKIDMASPNLHLRDPVIYRVLHAEHPHTGNQWVVYPMYDFAHPLEDAFEGVTHSLCTLEFEVHRPLYDWVIERLPGDWVTTRPRQTEFARLNLTYTVMSKRKLLELVQLGLVRGWHDPRLPTLGGLRRRGYTPGSIRHFCEIVGVTKVESLTDVALLEHCIRDDLNRSALRRMAVLRPLKVEIENAADLPPSVQAVNNPEDESAGSREIPISPEIFIEADDFMETPPPKYFRLTPGGSVRIRYAGFLTCTGVKKNPDGSLAAVVCRWSPPSAELKVKGTIHWVDGRSGGTAEVRMYDRLFSVEQPDRQEGRDFKEFLNPGSLEVVRAMVEPSLHHAGPDDRFQFERVGYFCVDPDSTPERKVFNRTVTLKDAWAKAQAKG
jgi:glutaminyl-tRNA synthetase